MASTNKPTIYQRLSNVFGNSTIIPVDYNRNNKRVNRYELNNSDILFTTTNKDEYERKKTELKQQHLLARQWKKAQYDISFMSLASLSNVQMMYREADLMDQFPEIGTALDVFMEESTYTPNNGFMVNITSKSNRIKSILSDLLVNRLSINVTLPMICRSTCKYGNTFMLLNIDKDNGIIGWRQLPVYEMQRYENDNDNPYASAFIPVNPDIDTDKPDTTKFVWVGKSEYTPYRNWQIAHFRLLYDSIFLPYGMSILNKARRHWRMLSMMEDMMLLYRLERSVERRVFKVYVGAIDDEDVPAYVDDIANRFKRTPVIDPETGQLDLRKCVLNQGDDFFIPTRDENASSPIETLPAAQNLTAMDDIKFVQNKLCTALRVPKPFLNFEEEKGEGKNLSLLDVRFTRTVNMIQQMILLELNKVCVIHLYLLGFTDDLTNFSLSMNNPSSQSEMLEIENLAKKVQTAKDAVTDPGGGIPLMSMTRAWKEVMGWSEKEIEQNWNEMRLEKALAQELAQTSAIIKRTGVFDNVDNIYGEPGAEYPEGQQGAEGGDEGGMPGGGGGGFGGGLDFGGDMGGDISGAEGEMDMGTAAGEDMGGAPDMGGGAMPEPPAGGEGGDNEPPQPMMESNRQVSLFDKAFLVNEELNSVANGLRNYLKETREKEDILDLNK